MEVSEVNDTTVVLGAIAVYLMAFFLLASAVLIPLFAGLALRYTCRTLWQRFSTRRL